MRDYYPNIPKLPGIYMWYNKVNGKKYIGSAKNLFERCGSHIRGMRGNNNKCGMLQAAYNKYGESALLFVVIIQCSEEQLLKFEQQFLDGMKPEYNKRLVAYSNEGLKMSEETKEKHRQRGKKRYPIEMIEETRRNHWLKGKHRPPETIEKMRAARLGTHQSDETKRKISEFHKGKVHQCKTLLGKLTSPEGIVYENITNMAKFCREHGLDRRRLSGFKSGQYKCYKGWKYVAI